MRPRRLTRSLLIPPPRHQRTHDEIGERCAKTAHTFLLSVGPKPSRTVSRETRPSAPSGPATLLPPNAPNTQHLQNPQLRRNEECRTPIGATPNRASSDTDTAGLHTFRSERPAMDHAGIQIGRVHMQTVPSSASSAFPTTALPMCGRTPARTTQ